MAGCSSRDKSALTVRLLKDSVPAEIVREFQRHVAKGTPFRFSASEQLADLYDLLTTWNSQSASHKPPQPKFGLPALPFGRSKSAAVADLITLGDYWLAPAIQAGLIQPFSLEDSARWNQIPPVWQSLVKRNRQGQLDPDGELWAAPYRWGTMAIAYRPDQFKSLGFQPGDWSDLWRPELKHRISLLDSPRSVIGLTLKKLGHSVNAENPADIPNLMSELQALNQQVKFYSSKAYLQPLLLKDTWLAVGWSTDIFSAVQREREISVAIPKSGTILTADLWVRPQTKPVADVNLPNPTGLLNQWIEFCWQPQIAKQLALLSDAASPAITETKWSSLPDRIPQGDDLPPPSTVLQQGEFLLPVPSATIDQIRRLWMTLRQTAT